VNNRGLAWPGEAEKEIDLTQKFRHTSTFVKAIMLTESAIQCYTPNRSSAELIAEVGLEIALGPDILNISTILQHSFLLLEFGVVFTVDICEAPLPGDNDLLASRELITGAAESLLDNSGVGLFAADGENDLADIDTSSGSVGLTPGTTHTGLESIRTGTAQHLVDSQNMEGVDTDTQMERVLSRGLGDILVGANTGRF